MIGRWDGGFGLCRFHAAFAGAHFVLLCTATTTSTTTAAGGNVLLPTAITTNVLTQPIGWDTATCSDNSGALCFSTTTTTAAVAALVAAAVVVVAIVAAVMGVGVRGHHQRG